MFKEIIGPAAVYEQLAEECSETAKAALKCARILRGENPTPVTLEEAQKNLIEEYTDVRLVADDLNLHPNPVTRNEKFKRWYDRLTEAGRIGALQPAAK